MKRFFTKSVWGRFFLVGAVMVLALLTPRSTAMVDAGSATSSDQPAPLTVLTTVRPLALIVKDLLGDELQAHVKLETLIAPDVSPHGFEPTPSQMARLQRADIVILNGHGLDDWAARQLPSSTAVLRFADVAGVSDHHHHHDHNGACCAHGHGPIDEHFWLDVELVVRFAEACRELLSDHLTSRFENGDALSAQLADRVAAFAESVEAVDHAFSATLQPFSRRRIVTHHDVFRRIASRYDLGDPLVLRPLASVEPSPGDLRRAIRAIRADRIQAILIEPQFSIAAAKRIQDETRVELVPVDPLGAEAESWSEMMNAIRLAIASSFREP